MQARKTLLLLALFATLALPSAGVASPSPVTVPDKVGDANGAPDLSEVTVSSNASNLTFKLTFASAEPLNPEEGVMLVLDSDDSTVTGDKYGDDIRLLYRQFDDGSYGGAYFRWDGTDWKAQPRSAKVSFDPVPGSLKIVLARDQLYGSWNLAWFAVTYAPGTDAADGVPNREAGSYSLRAGTTPDPAGRDKGTIRSVFSSFKPKLAFIDGVKPGQILELDLLFVKLPTNEKVVVHDMRCVAGVGGRALVPVRPCAWRVPASAHGKTVTVDIGVVYKGLMETGFISQFKVA